MWKRLFCLCVDVAARAGSGMTKSKRSLTWSLEEEIKGMAASGDE